LSLVACKLYLTLRAVDARGRLHGHVSLTNVVDCCIRLLRRWEDLRGGWRDLPRGWRDLPRGWRDLPGRWMDLPGGWIDLPGRWMDLQHGCS
jgi:hypothetical protein